MGLGSGLEVLTRSSPCALVCACVCSPLPGAAMPFRLAPAQAAAMHGPMSPYLHGPMSPYLHPHAPIPASPCPHTSIPMPCPGCSRGCRGLVDPWLAVPGDGGAGLRFRGLQGTLGRAMRMPHRAREWLSRGACAMPYAMPYAMSYTMPCTMCCTMPYAMPGICPIPHQLSHRAPRRASDSLFLPPLLALALALLTLTFLNLILPSLNLRLCHARRTWLCSRHRRQPLPRARALPTPSL